jgi:hypothetical protein
MIKANFYSVLLLFAFIFSCSNTNEDAKNALSNTKPKAALEYDSTIRTAHILVALCDNRYQGIVPVPAAIGNGEDFNKNLYWGCSFGIRSYFKASKDWKLIRKTNLDSIRLERLVFKSITSNFYLVCDAYKGKNIKECTIDFLNSAAGQLKDTLQINNAVIGINGNAKLLTYIGHDGLMDFGLNKSFKNADGKERDVVILACKSKKYFSSFIKNAKAKPLLWTSDLMCPEAYTIHDLINVYIKSPTDAIGMQDAGTKAYSKYQKCSVKASKNLLVTGF